MRLMGALGALALGMFIGYAKSYRVQARAQALSVFLEELPRLLLQMEYKTLPLSRLVQTLGRADGLLGPFWAAFGALLPEWGVEGAWIQALAEKAPYGLSEGDLAILRNAGPILSYPEAEGRKKSAQGLLAELTEQREALRREQEKRGNLYGTLGLLMGLAMAILIL